MVLTTLSYQNQRMKNGKVTNFAENNPSFENQSIRSTGVSSISKVNSDYERGTYKITDKSLEDTIQSDLEDIAFLLKFDKYMPHRLTNGETLPKITHEHQLRTNKKPLDEEEQKSINPCKEFGALTTSACSSDSSQGFSTMETRSSNSQGTLSTSVKLVEACSSIEAFVTEQYIPEVDEHTHDLHPSNNYVVSLPSEGEDLSAISECDSTTRTRKHKIPVKEIELQEVKIKRKTLTKETQIQVENMLWELAYSELSQFYMVDLPIQRRRALTNILKETKFREYPLWHA